MFPKEHGAYGQLGFPLATALVADGLSVASGFIALAAIALFMAHEPLLVVLGQRGPRARRDDAARARLWLIGTLLVAIVAGAFVVSVTPPAARWTLILPLLPGACLVMLTVRGREKTTIGETLVAVTFASIALPVGAAAGRPLANGLAIAVTFAFLFAASTLAVRVVILRTRGGGQPQAASHTRNLAVGVAAAGFAVGIAATAAGLFSGGVAFAMTPGLLFAIVIAAFPPRAIYLRRVGWTLVAVSALTSILLIAVT